MWEVVKVFMEKHWHLTWNSVNSGFVAWHELVFLEIICIFMVW